MRLRKAEAKSRAEAEANLIAEKAAKSKADITLEAEKSKTSEQETSMLVSGPPDQNVFGTVPLLYISVLISPVYSLKHR